MKTMRIPFSLYDAFAARAFTGNVAGVVVTERPLDVSLMQAIARELGAPTTGFVVAADAGVSLVRYFTPRQEIDACGHVTVALSVELGDRGLWSVNEGQSATFVAPTQAGEVAVRVQGRAGRVSVELTYAPRLAGRSESLRAEIQNALGVEPNTELAIELFATGLRHLVVPLASVSDLGAIRLDHGSIARLGASAGVDTVCVFAKHGRGAFRMRDLTAPIGDIEEPASGTTASALAMYAVRHDLADAGVNIEIEQGLDMGRPSRIDVTVDALTGVARVRGEAIRTATGAFVVGDEVARPEDRERARAARNVPTRRVRRRARQ
jgi:trans-2,3-dihydro-3-hydroxyanthranilate isomerase